MKIVMVAWVWKNLWNWDETFFWPKKKPSQAECFGGHFSSKTYEIINCIKWFNKTYLKEHNPCIVIQISFKSWDRTKNKYDDILKSMIKK